MADRVRITSSRRAGTRQPPRSMGRELQEETGVGEVYLRGLMAAQLRLSVTVLAVGVVLLGGLPLVFALVPVTRSVSLVGIPLPWLLLGLAVYPAALVAARFYVHQSERLERQFTDVASGPDHVDERADSAGSPDSAESAASPVADQGDPS